MKRDELIARLQEMPADLDVCVAFTPEVEMQLAGELQLIHDDEYGGMIVICGVEETR